MGMIVHAGGVNLESIDDFRSLKDPVPRTDTHYPIRHDYFFDLCKETLTPKGWNITSEEYALHQSDKHDNAFALWGLESETEWIDKGGCARMLGCRNSNTLDFSAQLGTGQRVTVCDNLLFSAAVVVGRKHTKNIMRDLPRLLTNAMGRASEEFRTQEKRTDVYKLTEIDRLDVNHIMMESVRAKVIPPSQLMHWVNEWEDPTHDEFCLRNAWSLQNAFTEVAKRWNFRTMQDRTHGLVGVMDRVVEFDSHPIMMRADLTEGVEDAEVISDTI
jgi:hypothetical protein